MTGRSAGFATGRTTGCGGWSPARVASTSGTSAWTSARTSRPATTASNRSTRPFSELEPQQPEAFWWADVVDQQPALAAVAEEKLLKPGVLLVGNTRRTAR